MQVILQIKMLMMNSSMLKFQWKKLQSKLAKMDELIKEMDSCRIALETGTTSKF